MKFYKGLGKGDTVRYAVKFGQFEFVICSSNNGLRYVRVNNDILDSHHLYIGYIHLCKALIKI